MMQTPLSSLDVEDAHIHFFSHRFFSLLAPAIPEAWARLGWEGPSEDAGELGQRWAAELDNHGVSRAALIGSLPGDVSSVKAAAVPVSGRFYWYAMVNPTAQQADTIADVDGICLFPAMHRYSIHDRVVTPFLHLAAGAKRLLFRKDSSFFPRGWKKVVFDAQVAALVKLGVGAEDAAAIFDGNLRGLRGA